MAKMKSWDELKKIREEAKAATDLRTTGEDPDRIVLAVGMATCGIAAGARDTMRALREEIEKQGLRNVSVVATGCFGYCYAEPMVEVRMPNHPPVRYGHVDRELAARVVTEHIQEGRFIDNAIIGQDVNTLE